MKKIIKEGLDYHDLEGQIEPRVSVDEYAAKMGEDSEIVTVTFIINSKMAAEDLVAWLEIGYDFVLDASVSEGELEPGKWLVFVEMKRRSNVPNKIVTMLSDLQTLTNMKLEDYDIIVDDKKYKADEDVLKKVIVLTSDQYNKDQELNTDAEDELNEMRSIAGLPNKKVFDNIDEEIRKYISNAGL